MFLLVIFLIFFTFNLFCIYVFREFFLMFRKMVFILFSLLTNISKEQKTTFLLMFSVFSITATIKCEPYVLRELNLLELHSSLIASITIFAGLLYVLDVGEFLKISFFVLIVLINTIFAMKWFFYFCDMLFYTYETKIFKVCPCLVRKLYILRQTIADTSASFNLPKVIFKFIKNLYQNQKDFQFIKLKFIYRKFLKIKPRHKIKN